MRFTATAIAAALLATAPLAGGAFAQTASPAEPAPGIQPVPQQGQTQGQSTEFSDQQLQSFAAAVQGIQDVANEFAPRLRDASDPDQLAELQQEAESKMLTAVEDEGLSVDEYNAIAVTAQTNPQVAETIRGYIVEDGGTQGQGQGQTSGQGQTQ
ncbi:MAG: DUF4168 domain-containing protein [Caenispirillum sp.]|nr:DUF4168 domain-containing protein [Caenispirillum sp.]